MCVKVWFVGVSVILCLIGYVDKILVLGLYLLKRFSMNFEVKFVEFGLKLFVVFVVGGNYVFIVCVGNLFYCVGMISLLDGKMIYEG